MTAAVAQPRGVPTTLYYYLEQKDGGVYDTYPGTAAEKRRKHVPHDVTVRDMRMNLSDFTTDSCGFQLVPHRATEKEFADEEAVRRTYYPEIEDLIKETYGL